MSIPNAEPTSGGFSRQDWATLLSGVGQGASTGLQSSASLAQSKREAKEIKRQTLADLLNKALRRQLSLYRANTEYRDDLIDHQNSSLQEMARGFVNSLKGSTGKRING